MEKITKKKFREIIENNKNALIGNFPVSKWTLEAVDEFATDERVNAITAPEWRVAVQKRSSSIIFSNGARLDFKSGDQYYQRGNLLFLHIADWQTMVYLVA